MGGGNNIHAQCHAFVAKYDRGVRSRDLKPSLPCVTDFITLRWLIGNALLDPFQEHRVIVLLGRGGSGKCTITRFIQACMIGCVRPIDGSILTSTKAASLPGGYTFGVVGSRMMIGVPVGNHKHADHEVNNRQDILRHPDRDMLRVRASTSAIMCTNVPPHGNKTNEYHTPAITRRLVMIPMNVDARNIMTSPEPTSSEALGAFLFKRVSEYKAYRDMPVSAQPVCY
jgi:hypothetical protein